MGRPHLLFRLPARRSGHQWRLGVALVTVLGCGPSADFNAGSDTSTDTTQTSAPAQSSSGAPDADTAADLGTSGDPVAATSTSTSTGDTTGLPDEGAFECGCEQTIEIPYAEPVDKGVSAAAVMRLIASRDVGFEWTGFANSLPDSSMHIEIAYDGGPVLHGPDGEDGCAFLSQPCPSSLAIPATATIMTTDGVLEGTFPGEIQVDLDEFFENIQFRADLPARRVGGTLTAQELEPPEETLTRVDVVLVWQLDGTWDQARVFGTRNTGAGDILGLEAL